MNLALDTSNVHYILLRPIHTVPTDTDRWQQTCSSDFVGYNKYKNKVNLSNDDVFFPIMTNIQKKQTIEKKNPSIHQLLTVI